MTESLPEISFPLVEALDRCARCGQCRSLCPVFERNLNESDVARGRISLLQAFLEGQSISEDKLGELFYSCIKCYRCEANCPSHVEYGPIISSMGFLFGLKGSWVRLVSWMLRWILPRRRLYDGILCLARWSQIMLPSQRGMSMRHLPISLFHRKAMPALAKVPALRRAPESEGRGGVLLFTGCLGNYVYPQTVRSTESILRSAGFRVEIPRQQLCCGMPLKAIGDKTGARRLAEKNADLFESMRPDWIVSPCPTCAGHLKRGYVELIGDRAMPWMDHVKDMSELLVQESDLLDREAKALSGTLKPRVVYHDPCHLLWVLRVREEPRRLLQEVSVLLETEQGPRCCGMGGIFSALHPLLASQIGSQRANDLLSANPEEVVTGCPGCMLQLQERILASGHSIPVLHTSEVIARHLDRQKR